MIQFGFVQSRSILFSAIEIGSVQFPFASVFNYAAEFRAD